MVGFSESTSSMEVLIDACRDSLTEILKVGGTMLLVLAGTRAKTFWRIWRRRTRPAASSVWGWKDELAGDLRTLFALLGWIIIASYIAAYFCSGMRVWEHVTGWTLVAGTLAVFAVAMWRDPQRQREIAAPEINGWPQVEFVITSILIPLAIAGLIANTLYSDPTIVAKRQQFEAQRVAFDTQKRTEARISALRKEITELEASTKPQ